MADILNNTEVRTEAAYPILNTLDDRWKMKLLFVKAGFAKVGDASIEHVSPEKLPGYLQTAQTELQKIGLIAQTEAEFNIGRIYFAKTPEDLTKLRSLNETTSTEEWGEIYGIPQTAREAYPNDLMSDEHLPPKILQNPLFKTFPYRPSLSDYQGEWDTFVAQANQIKKEFPQLVKDLNLEELYNLK